MVDGKKHYRSERDYWLMQRESDELCREYGLSVVEEPKRGKSKHYAEHKAEREGNPTWRTTIKAEIDEAISQSMTENQFIMNLKKRGYEVKLGKDISIRPPYKERFFRLERNFGEVYSRQGIIQQMRGRRPTLPEPPPKQTVKKVKLKGNIQTTKKITGFRALYFHYLYLLGKIPKQRQKPPSKVHFLFREDLIKIDKISNEIKLLSRNHIDTSEQLFSYKAELTDKIDILTIERADLRKQLRRVGSESSKEEIKAKISILTKGLSEVRKEVVLCDDIADRTKQIKEKRLKVRQEQTQKNLNKEVRKRYESFR
jgi:hypothetical protein